MGVHLFFSGGEHPTYSIDKENLMVSQNEPAPKHSLINYKPYLEKIQFIMLVVGEKEYNAALCSIQKPCEKGFEKMEVTCLDNNIAVGSIADTPVLIVTSLYKEKLQNNLDRALDYCPKAQYILSVGTGYAFQKTVMKPGDVLISSSISYAEHYTVKKLRDTTTINIQEIPIEINDLLQRIFCNDPGMVEDFYLSTMRTAKYHTSKIILGINSYDASLQNSKKITVYPDSIGGDFECEELISVQRSGRIKGFIVVKSVTKYADGSYYNQWDFTGAMSAFHYIKMKMIPYIKHINSVNYYLESIKSSKDVMEVAVAKLIFLGPSMQGKTVTRKRLTNVITNISSDTGEDKSNTGISDQTTVMCKNIHRSTILVAGEADWKIIDEQEVEMFMKAKSRPKNGSKQTQSDSSIVREHSFEDKPQLNYSEKSSSCVESTEEYSCSPSKRPRVEADKVPLTKKILTIKPVKINSKNIAHILQTKKSYKLSDINLQLENGCMIYLQDTGGQPELMDCLPALTIGPALYLLFCKLDTSLEDHYKIGYRGTDGKPSSIMSHFKIKETLLSALVSISSMIYSSSDNALDIKQQTENRKQCVYIVGTHKDKTSDDCIYKLENDFRALISGTFFDNVGLIKEWQETDLPPDTTLKANVSRLIYPLDNLNGEHEEIKHLRNAISKKIYQHARKHIPRQWLVFSIILRERPEVILTIENCYTIGEYLSMTTEETDAALHFFHYNLGICMHFANIEELKHVVITNTQAIYQSLTKIIEAAFKPGIVHSAARSNLKNNGKFSLASFSCEIETPMKLEMLVLILEHLNIIAQVVSSNREETVYFMPCVLPNASDEELKKYEDRIEMLENISPLYIRYDCGFVPLGVFPAMVANLIQQGSQKEGENIRLLSLQVEGNGDDCDAVMLKRNCIQFSYGEDHDTITLIHTSEYIKVRICRKSYFRLQLHELCPRIRRLLKTTIDSVLGTMLHSLYTDISIDQYKNYFEEYCFAFKCYEHPKPDHLCKVSNKDRNPIYMDCVKGKELLMKPEHLVWYGKEIVDTSSQCNTGLLNDDQLGTIFKEVYGAREKWRNIGLIIGVKIGDLKVIRADHRDVDDCCQEMLYKWLTNSSERTWRILAEALENETVGFPNIAETIRKKYIENV